MDAAQGRRSYAGSRLERAGGLRYVHDAAGRVVERCRKRLSRKPAVWRYVWDAEDRLISVRNPDGTAWRYSYDPLGRRIAKERLGDDGHSVVERTDFTWDGPVLVEETTRDPALPNAVTLTWDHSGLRPIAQTERLTDSATQEEVDARFHSGMAVVDELGRLRDHEVPAAFLLLWSAGVTGVPEPLAKLEEPAVVRRHEILDQLLGVS
ncbi:MULTISPECIES: RHS repeat domain-containing protein [unclassified Streptomyces]|uniref:RHS repeat domain-containing protein n=1 Tax=unclassified Streptomyces TaxID=2593676 RepID=UPI00099D1D9C|nr:MULTISPECIES: RHS repeat domain-containing protein [unclassified Streptomyces]